MIRKSTLSSLQAFVSQNSLQAETVTVVEDADGYLHAFRPKLKKMVLAPNASQSKEPQLWELSSYRGHYDHVRRQWESHPNDTNRKKWNRIENYHPDQLVEITVLVL